MPFTAAHPAIILPLLRLKRLQLSATGLVAGSIAPDFEYFIRLKIFTTISHTFLGILVFNIPVALALSLLFHLLVRRLVVQNLPLYFRQRALAVPEVNWPGYLRRHPFIFLVSVFIGAGLHIFWDGFTHFGGFAVQLFPELGADVHLFGYAVPLCRVFQHLSTLIGFAALWWHIERCPTVPLSSKAKSSRHWLSFWFIIFIFGISFLFLLHLSGTGVSGISDNVVVLISGCLLAVLLAGLLGNKSQARVGAGME